ncbi:hypothetical protein RchiOBHm_Chr7g0192151 [Rosa chinensis]|uniref:Uncharacterized protein n=1 Tax=Rosa chinensis TaxID=74649 RepID=A0A2P6P5J2_ROSCH|nr:hypothetical protein RchiOBHm_Chr7g0192151 [Rosa chinensis]
MKVVSVPAANMSCSSAECILLGVQKLHRREEISNRKSAKQFLVFLKHLLETMLIILSTT